MFKLEEFEGKKVLKSTLIPNEVEAFFTTKELPLKCGERIELAEKIEDNIKLIEKTLEKKLIIPEQTHSENIGIIKNTVEIFEDTDALITNKEDVAIALNFADCTPIIFYDTKNKIIAAAHAGWRGTAQKIASKTIDKMIKEFDTNPKDIIALIGPAIEKCCYQVGEDVLEKLLRTISKEKQKEVYIKKDDKYFVDLKAINKYQILATGVEKIDLCEDCTCCSSELFFSYRAQKGHTARHSAVIALK